MKLNIAIANEYHNRSPRTAVLGLGVCILAMLVVLVTPRRATASGDEKTTTADDLVIRTDTRWTGGNMGGYLPVRVEVVNHALPRTLLFEVTPNDETHGATVRRRIGVDQNTTVRFTLSIPLTAFTGGMLRTYDEGKELKAHSRWINGASPNSTAASALLVISSSPVDCIQYAKAADAQQDSFRAGMRMHSVTPDPAAFTQVVPPEQLPDSWIDYSGLDFVAISREELGGLEPAARSAILKWVHCGGNLIVYNVGGAAKDLEALERLVGFADHAAIGTAWQMPDGRPLDKHDPTDWATSNGFATRELVLGLVCAFPQQPFRKSEERWERFLKAVGPSRFSWTQRHGMSAQFGTAEFFKFMNPDVRSVPVYGFMTLITLFAVLIGPVNYLYLQRKKMLWLLLFTVPAMALLTSALLVGYSVAAHGFSVKSRIRSLTVLDQKSRSAVTMARLSLFAGMAPSGGMRFSPETAVYPAYPPMQEPAATLVDWTETQSLPSGWLFSRTRTQFLTIRNAEQRARVEIKPRPQGGLELSNGLPWDLDAVVVADDSGKLFLGRDVLANASAALVSPSVKDLRAFVDKLVENRPDYPDGFTSPVANPFDGRANWRYRMLTAGIPSLSFDTNLMERLIQNWSTNLPSNEGLKPRSYLAILHQNPDVETGVPRTTEQMGYHLLLGYY